MLKSIFLLYYYISLNIIMGRIFFCLIVLVWMISACENSTTQDGFTINGTISAASKQQAVFLIGDSIKDSTVAINGKFHFSGHLNNGPEQAMLQIYNANKTHVEGYLVWVENTKITFTNNSRFGNIKGSKTQDEQEMLDKQTTPIMDSMVKLSSKMIDEKKSNPIDSLRVSKLEDKTNGIYLNYALTHPNSLVSLNNLKIYYSTWGKKIDETLYNKMNSTSRKSPAGKEVLEFIHYNKNLNEGDKFADFVQYDVKGNKVRLSDFAGKPIILEFWISGRWPCRRQNLELKKIYQKYRSSGLEIVAVSVDDDKEDWEAAINEDKLSWINLSEFGSANKAAMTYGISEFPTTFLINKNGIIVKKHIGQYPSYGLIPGILKL